MSLVVFPVNNKKRPIVSGWQTYSGKVNTPMYGIAVPKGVYIIDLDLYKGVTTCQVEKLLGCELDWDGALIQKTLNGGQHYAFRCDVENLIQDSDIFDLVGFDSRAAGRGYIATGKGYEDMTLLGIEVELSNPEFLPELPQSAIVKLSSQAELADDYYFDDGVFDDSLMVAISEQPLDLATEEVEMYLDLLSDDYFTDDGKWHKVGMAIAHQYSDSEEGYKIFDEFSKRSLLNYDEIQNRTRYKSFRNRPKNPITFAYVIKAAGGKAAISQKLVKSISEKVVEAKTTGELKEHMSEIANSKLDSLAADVLLKSVQKQYEVITKNKVSLPAVRKEIRKLRKEKKSGDFVDDYIYVTAHAIYLERESKAKMVGQAFNVKHNRETPADTNGDPQTACRYADNNIEIVHDTMYHPQALIANGDPIFERSGQTYFNTYTPPRIKRVPAGTTNAVDVICQHIAHLLPNPTEQDIVINYLAHNVQRPGVKIPWGILLQGIPGDGKSAFAVMMAYLLGDENTRTLDPRELLTSFTGWAVGQVMTFVEEVLIGGKSKYDTMNAFKPYVSNETVPVTRKGEDPTTAINTTNYFLFSNYQDAIPIDDGDRRYAILFSQWQNPERLAAFQMENPTYYEDLYNTIRNNPGELLDWLMTHDIPQEFLSMQRAPVTDARRRAIQLSKSTGHEQVEDALEEFADQVFGTLGELNITLLQELANNDAVMDLNSNYNDFPKDRTITKILIDMGYQASGRRGVPELGGRKCRFYKKI